MGYGELELASWRAKAVKDDIVKSWLCVDCGMNTHPGCPDGPRIRIDIALYGKFALIAKLRSTRSAIQSGKKPAWPAGVAVCVSAASNEGSDDNCGLRTSTSTTAPGLSFRVRNVS